jgi:hypothetical protein
LPPAATPPSTERSPSSPAPEPARRGRPRPRRLAVALLALVAGSGFVVAGREREVDSATVRDVVPAPARLTIDDEEGDVTVVGEARDDVLVETRLRWTGARPRVRVVPVDGVLRLTGSCDRLDVRLVADDEWRWGSECAVSYRVRVPAALDVRVATGTGDVRLEGLRGALDAETRAGSVTAVALRSPHVTLRASGPGDVRASFAAVAGAVDVRAARGDVRLALPAGRYHLAADAPRGRAWVGAGIDADAASRRTVSASAGGGDVIVDAAR